MQPWDVLKLWTGFDADDERRLAALLPLIERDLPQVSDHFYAAILRFPSAAAVFKDEAQVQRLKGTLQIWVRELLLGPHDHAYLERRQRIGRAHVRVGLPEHYVFPAMNLIRSDLCAFARRALGGEVAWDTCHSLQRIMDLELAIITSAYREAHEAVQLSALQDLIIRNLPMTVLCLDAEGRVTAATQPSARLFNEGGAQIGSAYDHFLPGDLIEAADLPSRIGRALATGRTVTVPRVLLGAGRDTRTFRVSVVPLRHELAQVLVHLEELTDAVQAEARAQQAEALAGIGRLAANVAHEIRNPLAAISATLQVISSSLTGDDRRRTILGKVQDQVIRLDRLVSDLLGYSRNVEVRARPTTLAELARESVVVAGVGAEVEVLGAPMALVDGQYTQQILVNLLQNARDASGPHGRVRVTVGPGSEIAVADNGPGVASEVLSTLFDPFVTTKTKGTGLGLAISRKYAEAMGGRLCLDAPSGAGACFRLLLPEAPPAWAKSHSEPGREDTGASGVT